MLHIEIENTKKRLDFYAQQRNRLGSTPTTKASAKNGPIASVDKWIEIYSERLKRLERQASKSARTH